MTISITELCLNSTMKEPIHHTVVRLFSEPQNSWAISGLINCTSCDFQDQNLSLMTGCDQDLIFPVSWIGEGKLIRVFTICCLTKHITPLHLPTPTLKMTISCLCPHELSPQFILHLMNSGHSISFGFSIIHSPCFLRTHLLMNEACSPNPTSERGFSSELRSSVHSH